MVFMKHSMFLICPCSVYVPTNTAQSLRCMVCRLPVFALPGIVKPREQRERERAQGREKERHFQYYQPCSCHELLNSKPVVALEASGSGCWPYRLRCCGLTARTPIERSRFRIWLLFACGLRIYGLVESITQKLQCGALCFLGWRTVEVLQSADAEHDLQHAVAEIHKPSTSS